MYTLNITVKVAHEIAEEWIEWQKKVHIPASMETACFSAFHFHRLLGHDEEDGQIFVVQFIVPSQEKYTQFITGFDEELRKATLSRWGDKVFEFRTILKKI